MSFERLLLLLLSSAEPVEVFFFSAVVDGEPCGDAADAFRVT